MPAPRSRAATAASRGGTWFRSSGEPAVVVTPATSKVSLIVHGTPWNGPHQSRRARASSAARARSTASGAKATIALSLPLYWCDRSSIRVVSSTAETCPLRIARAASSAEAKSRSLAPAREARTGASALVVSGGQPSRQKPPTRQIPHAHSTSSPGVGIVRPVDGRAGNRASAASSRSRPRPGRVGTAT